MRTLGKIAATLGVIGAIAVSSAVPAAAWYGYHPTTIIPTAIIATTAIIIPTIIITIITTGIATERKEQIRFR